MNEPQVQFEKTLAELGAGTPQAVERLFAEVRARFEEQLSGPLDEAAWEQARVAWTGRKSGALTRITENWLKAAPGDLRRVVGAQLNELKRHVEARLEERKREIAGAAEARAVARERVDLSLPGVEPRLGTRHVLTQTLEDIERIFLDLGYTVVEGPEIETPYYNFEALNIPEHHPARDTMDTFYLEGRPGRLLRTHTSPMQVRTMEKQKPPVRIIVPGKVYRRDNPDATHSYMFTQVEGLAVDADITFCDFKGTVDYLVKQFFGPRVRTRLRPSYFQFTEPSAEVDGSCHVCGGEGCRICKYTGWIELFGAGMVNPAVYGFVGYDPQQVSGFAFGIGVERFAILKYGIEDIQMLFQNDVRFLRQFRVL